MHSRASARTHTHTRKLVSDLLGIKVSETEDQKLMITASPKKHAKAAVESSPPHPPPC
jgi:hypothetical protein